MRNFAYVVNGVVTSTRLPRSGRLRDGRTVSNYHLLDPAILKAEGWLPLIDEPPSAGLLISWRKP